MSGSLNGFEIVDKLRVQYRVTVLCETFGLHRSSYRYWHTRVDRPDAERATKRGIVHEAWIASGGSAGARNIATMVTNKAVKLGRWLAGKSMKKMGLVSSRPPAHKYPREGNERVDIPNSLSRQFAVTEPNQVWCGDVTYIWEGNRWAHLALVLDHFARKPIGWALSYSPDSNLISKCINNDLGT